MRLCAAVRDRALCGSALSQQASLPGQANGSVLAMLLGRSICVCVCVCVFCVG